MAPKSPIKQRILWGIIAILIMFGLIGLFDIVRNLWEKSA